MALNCFILKRDQFLSYMNSLKELQSLNLTILSDTNKSLKFYWIFESLIQFYLTLIKTLSFLFLHWTKVESSHNTSFSSVFSSSSDSQLGSILKWFKLESTEGSWLKTWRLTVVCDQTGLSNDAFVVTINGYKHRFLSGWTFGLN